MSARRFVVMLVLLAAAMVQLQACGSPTQPTHLVCRDTMYFRPYPPEVSNKLAMYLTHCEYLPL